MHRIFHDEGDLQSNKLKKLIHNARISRNVLFGCSVCTYPVKKETEYLDVSH
jgi:hypothetical protein